MQLVVEISQLGSSVSLVKASKDSHSVPLQPLAVGLALVPALPLPAAGALVPPVAAAVPAVLLLAAADAPPAGMPLAIAGAPAVLVGPVAVAPEPARALPDDVLVALVPAVTLGRELVPVGEAAVELVETFPAAPVLLEAVLGLEDAAWAGSAWELELELEPVLQAGRLARRSR